MKYALLIFSLVLTSCFSSKRSSAVDINQDARLEHSTHSQETFSKQMEMARIDTFTTHTVITEETRTIFFDRGGAIRAVQETKRGTRQDELGISRGVASEFFGINKNDSSHTNAGMYAKKNETTQQQLDNRPLSGSNGVLVGLITGLVVTCLIAVASIKFFRK